MWEEIAKAIPIYFSSMFKFIFGPMGGYLARLNIFTTIFITVAGTMTVTLLFAFFGDLIRKKVILRYFRPKKRFTDRNRRFVTIWKKYGLAGVAALTPVLLTPLGGVLLAVSFGSPKDKLIIYMFISASSWAVLLTTIIYLFGNNVLPEWMRP